MRSEFQVSILEISGPDHASILGDRRFIGRVMKLLMPDDTLLSMQNSLLAQLNGSSVHNRLLSKRRTFAHPADGGILCISEQKYSECPEGSRPMRWVWANVQFACFYPEKTGTGRLISATLLKKEQNCGDEECPQEERLDRLIWRAKRKLRDGGRGWLVRMEEREEKIPLSCFE